MRLIFVAKGRQKDSSKDKWKSSRPWIEEKIPFTPRNILQPQDDISLSVHTGINSLRHFHFLTISHVSIYSSSKSAWIIVVFVFIPYNFLLVWKKCKHIGITSHRFFPPSFCSARNWCYSYEHVHEKNVQFKQKSTIKSNQ